jgi:hypothetical protein
MPWSDGGRTRRVKVLESARLSMGVGGVGFREGPEALENMLQLLAVDLVVFLEVDPLEDALQHLQATRRVTRPRRGSFSHSKQKVKKVPPQTEDWKDCVLCGCGDVATQQKPGSGSLFPPLQPACGRGSGVPSRAQIPAAGPAAHLVVLLGCRETLRDLLEDQRMRRGGLHALDRHRHHLGVWASPSSSRLPFDSRTARPPRNFPFALGAVYPLLADSGPGNPEN